MIVERKKKERGKYFDEAFPRREWDGVVTAKTIRPTITVDKFVFFCISGDVFIAAIAPKMALAPFAAERQHDLAGRALETAPTKLTAFFVVMLFAIRLAFQLKVLAARKWFQALDTQEMLFSHSHQVSTATSEVNKTKI